MTMKLRALLLAAAAAFALSGCLLDQQPVKPMTEDPIVEGDPNENDPPVTECASPLCRLKTPADTTKLTPDQKEELIELIEAADDSAVVTVTTIDVEALSDTTLRNEVLKDLQTELFKDMQIPVNPLLLSQTEIDSVLAGVVITANGDTSVTLQWSGPIANVQVDMVSLNVKGEEFLGGYAVVDGKVYTFTALGDGTIAIVHDSKTLWMGECPPMPKRAGAQLTCAIALP